MDALFDPESMEPPRWQPEPDPAARRRNLEDGRQRADDGAAAVLANTPIGARDVAEDVVRQLAAEPIDWTAETARERNGGHVLGAHPNALAAVIRKAARDGLIVCVGVTTATRPEARGRLLRVWRGREVA